MANPGPAIPPASVPEDQAEDVGKLSKALSVVLVPGEFQVNWAARAKSRLRTLRAVGILRKMPGPMAPMTLTLKQAIMGSPPRARHSPQ